MTHRRLHFFEDAKARISLSEVSDTGNLYENFLRRRQQMAHGYHDFFEHENARITLSEVLFRNEGC